MYTLLAFIIARVSQILGEGGRWDGVIKLGFSCVWWGGGGGVGECFGAGGLGGGEGVGGGGVVRGGGGVRVLITGWKFAFFVWLIK